MKCKLIPAIVTALALFSNASWAQTTLNSGDILVVDPFAEAVIRVDPTNPAGSPTNPNGTSNQTTVSSGQLFSLPVALTMSLDGKYIYVSDRNAGIIRVDPSLPNGSNQTLIGPPPPDASDTGIAVAPAGSLYAGQIFISNFSPAEIIRVDPSSGSQSVFTAGNLLTLPLGIEFDALGNLLVSDAQAFGGQGGIIRVDQSGNQTKVSSGGFFGCPYGNTIEGDGTILATIFPASPSCGSAVFPAGVTSNQQGAITGVNPSTGTQNQVSPNETTVSCSSLGQNVPNCLGQPRGPSVDPLDNIIVADPDSGGHHVIWNVNPATGLQTPVSGDGIFQFPIDTTIFKVSTTTGGGGSTSTFQCVGTVVAQKWTGGGKIPVTLSSGAMGTASFGLSVSSDASGNVKGQLEYFDHVNKLHAHSMVIDHLVSTDPTNNKKACFDGTVSEKVNGGSAQGPCHFIVNVSDDDPTDSFSINIEAENGCVAEQQGPSTLSHGNINQHAK